MAFGDRDGALDPGHQARGFAARMVDAQEVFRNDRLGIAVAEFPPEPFPSAWPVVSAFLLLAPDDALGEPLGLAQRHGALIAVSDTARRIFYQRGPGRRWRCPERTLS